ncbi:MULTISPECIES: hypothetical protein, partial [Sinorhizobium]|uniref:hypothetical protein n=1 Tax=Sinorhizobium TaxID=28105 RepID=UPI001AECFE82
SRELRRPRFSFSIFNCQKTDGKNSRQRSQIGQNSRPSPKISIRQSKGNSRAKVVVASSAAALVSDRAYRPHTSDTSTDIFKKSIDFCKLLICHTDFDTID